MKKTRKSRFVAEKRSKESTMEYECQKTALLNKRRSQPVAEKTRPALKRALRPNKRHSKSIAELEVANLSRLLLVASRRHVGCPLSKDI